MSSQLDYANLTLLHGVERLHRLGGTRYLRRPGRLGVVPFCRSEIEILIRRHRRTLQA